MSSIDSSTSPRVVFVCWGNICRSPMAERVARAQAEREGIRARFTSAATSTEEIGSKMDPRAAEKLRAAGYDPENHSAHQITPEEIADADLVIAMEDLHLSKMRGIAGGELGEHVRLLTDFDPDAEPGSGVPDPWYGNADGFADTLATIESAMPGILAEVKELAP